MKGFKCGYCNDWHEELPLDIAIKMPISYFSVPEEDREEKVWDSPYFIKIDNREFFIRGLIYIPITDYEDDFCWGAWVKVTQDDYEYIWNTWENNTEGKVLSGLLDVEIPTYEDTSKLKVSIYLHGEEEQPTFIIKNTSSKLGNEQLNGINIERVLTINHEVIG